MYVFRLFFADNFWRILIINLSRGEGGISNFPFMTFASQTARVKYVNVYPTHAGAGVCA